MKFKKRFLNKSKAIPSKKQDSSTIECWNCFEYGHTLNQCTNKSEDNKFCLRCKNKGHEWSDCKIPNAVLRQKFLN